MGRAGGKGVQGSRGGVVRSVAGMGAKPLVHWPTRAWWWPWAQWLLGSASLLQGMGKKAKHKAYSAELVC